MSSRTSHEEPIASPWWQALIVELVPTALALPINEFRHSCQPGVAHRYEAPNSDLIACLQARVGHIRNVRRPRPGCSTSTMDAPANTTRAVSSGPLGLARVGFGSSIRSPRRLLNCATRRGVALSDNVSETTTPVKFTVEGDGVVSHVSFYQS